MKIIFQIAIFLLGFGGGGFGLKFMGDRKIAKLNKVHKKEINLKVDTIQTLRQNVRYIVSQDSLKSELITQMQGTFKDLKKQNTTQLLQLRACEVWKLDAADGVITDTVTIKVKRKLFGGYRIVN